MTGWLLALGRGGDGCGVDAGFGAGAGDGGRAAAEASFEGGCGGGEGGDALAALGLALATSGGIDRGGEAVRGGATDGAGATGDEVGFSVTALAAGLPSSLFLPPPTRAKTSATTAMINAPPSAAETSCHGLRAAGAATAAAATTAGSTAAARWGCRAAFTGEGRGPSKCAGNMCGPRLNVLAESSLAAASCIGTDWAGNSSTRSSTPSSVVDRPRGALALPAPTSSASSATLSTVVAASSGATTLGKRSPTLAFAAGSFGVVEGGRSH